MKTMREIKFRAKIKKSNFAKYKIGDWIYYSSRDVFENNFGHNLIEIENECEYTGLKDKNDKEAYWDDIVSDGFNPPFKIEAFNYPMLARLSEIEFEIIGNIYENPELLK